MTELTLWMGTVAQGSFTERLAAAATCGYSGMSVSPTDCSAVPPSRMSQLAGDAGIKLVALDPLVCWLPHWDPPPIGSIDPARLELMNSLMRFDVERALDLAAALGCTAVSVIEPYATPVPLEIGAEAFADACDRAADRGLVLQLEAMPFSGIPDLEAARSIVQLAGRDNGGLMLDTWHLFRSGGTAALVETLPLEHLSVQLSDAPALAEADLWSEALERRLLPCQGALDLAGVLAVLLRRGFAGPIGPEVISSELRRLDPVDAAHRAKVACQQLFTAVGL